MGMMVAVLASSLIHVVFLIAIGRRLTHLEYPGSTVLSVIFVSIGLWAVAFVFGAIFDIEILTIYFGLPIAIVAALLRYLWLEVRIQIENQAERDRRITKARAEVEQHQVQRQAEDQQIGQLVPVKNYVGDDQSMLAISDLGKLRDHNIPCRIDGNMVKTLFIAESFVAAASQIIDVQVSDLSDGDTEPQSPA
jgi:hypothetical protein